MVIRAQVCDLVTGGKLQTLPAANIRWEQRILEPETMRVEVTLKPDAHQLLDLRGSTWEARTALVISDGNKVLGAGPIWEREYDDKTRKWSCTASGLWSLLDHRYILPNNATASNLLITVGDKEDTPNPTVATVFTAKTWPQIVQGLLTQAATRPGGQLPLVYGAKGTGSHDKSYDASSFKSIGEALDDLTRLMDGPEIRFTPRIRDNRLEWVVEVGDDTQPEITSQTEHRFDFTAPAGFARALKTRSSGKELASEVWATGGRQASKALFARAYDDSLIRAGFPRMEMVSSAHSTVVEQSTLDRYARQDVQTAARPLEWWSWEFHADHSPLLELVNVGDYCRVHVRGHRYIPDSPPEGYRRRIVALSGDSRSRWVSVTTDEVRTW